MTEQNLDHHNGKVVKSVQASEGRSTITFEDDAVINVPGVISTSIRGQALLAVEPGPSLVFGMTQKDGPSIRQTEIKLPKEEETEGTPEATEETVEAKPESRAKGGRQSRSKTTDA